MQGFRLYEINFDALESEIYRTELQVHEAIRISNRFCDTSGYNTTMYYEKRLERLLKVKEWYKQRIIKFIEQL